MEIMWMMSLLVAGPVYAAAVTDRALLPRQTNSVAASTTSTTKPYSTLGYYSNGVDSANETPTTIWAPITVPTTTPYYFSTTNDFIRLCNLYPVVSTSRGSSTTSYSTSWGTTSATYSCVVWTSCGGGYLYGAGASTFCQNGDYRCMTYNILPSYGATEGVKSLTCLSSNSGRLTETNLYKALPPSTGLTAPSTNNADSVTSGSPTAGSTVPNPTQTPKPTPASSSNTGVIAGSVVGGLAVLAIAGVAVLFILRRNKKNKTDAPTIATTENPNNPYDHDPNNPYAHQQVPAPYYPPYQDDKPQELHGNGQQPIYEAPGNTAFVGVSPHGSPQGSPGLPNASPHSTGYASLAPNQDSYGGGNEYRPTSTSPAHAAVQSSIPMHPPPPNEIPTGRQ